MIRFSRVGVFIFLLTWTWTWSAQAAPVQSKNYAEVQTFLRELTSRFPGNAAIFELGVSDSGRVIEGLRIGSGPIKNLVVATHHGNEYGSTEVAKGVAASLAENPILGQTVYVIPVLNIPGFDRRSRWEPRNGAQLDPNRDYPGPCGTSGPFKLKSTQALAGFIDREGIVASATLHTHLPAVLYPWGISTQEISTPYDDLFIQLGQAATVESGYQVGNSTAVLYAADGTFEDYAFWRHGIWSLLFEMGRTHSPRPDAIAELIRVNVPGIRRFLEQAPTARAENHDFTGKCDRSVPLRDRYLE